MNRLKEIFKDQADRAGDNETNEKSVNLVFGDTHTFFEYARLLTEPLDLYTVLAFLRSACQVSYEKGLKDASKT